MMYRNKKLLSLAKECPSCMICGKANDGTVVAAHSNWHGKGMGLKTHDNLMAYICSSCHYEIDNGKHLSKEERKAYWVEAHIRTMIWLFTSGRIVVR